MTLPVVPLDDLTVMPIDWTGLPRQYLNFGELEIIIALVRSVIPHTVIEIGLAQGRTALAILREIPQIERYVGIDTLPGYQPKLKEQLYERSEEPGYLAMSDPRFEQWLRPRGTLDLMPWELPAADAVFIDGDHSSEVVAHDSCLARSATKQGGIIIWHDAGNESVEVRSVLEQDWARGCDIKVIEGTWLAFERIV